jgi:putative polyhydroxyalkanoate system protein
VLHSDNGGPMKGSTMLATLQRLGVIASFSRPSVSDDNPFAEAEGAHPATSRAEDLPAGRRSRYCFGGMATIRIRRSHALPSDHVRRTAESLARRIEQRLAVRWRWDGDAIELHAPQGPASGARGRVTVGNGDVAIEIHLPLSLFPLKVLVERRIVAKLDELLGAA